MNKRFLGSLLTLLVVAVLNMTGVAHTQSTTAFVPAPIVTTIAGVASASQGSAYTNQLGSCTSGLTNSLNSSLGTYNIGDNCLPTQATILDLTDIAVDSYGNVYWGDYGGTINSLSIPGSIRVLYKGGAAAAGLIYGANSWNSSFTAVYGSASTVQTNGVGKVFSVGGGYANALSGAKGQNCGGNSSYPTGYTATGDGCPATLAQTKALHAITVDKYGNVYYVSGQSSSSVYPGVHVIYAGGTQAANLITTLNTSSSTGVGSNVQVGYVYALGFTGDATLSKYGTYGDGGPATGAAMINPAGIAVDSRGNIFITDGKALTSDTISSVKYQDFAPAGNNVREIFGVTNGYNLVGNVTTVAGETACGGDYIDTIGNHGLLTSISVDSANGPTARSTSNTASIVVSYYPYSGYGATSGVPYGCPTSNQTESYIVSGSTDTMAYYPPYSNYYDGDGGPATSGYINYPQSIVLDGNDNLYIAEYGSNRIRVVYSGNGTLPSAVYNAFGSSPVAGDIYTYAGVANGGSTGYGNGSTVTNGTSFPTSNNYSGVAANNAYILFAGSNGSINWTSLGVDQAGNIYSYDAADKIVWKIDPVSYTAIRWLGGGNYNNYTAGNYCSTNTSTGSGPKVADAYGSGCPAIQSFLDSAGKIVFDNAGNIYIANPGESGATLGTNVIQELSLNNQFAATADNSTTSQYVAFEQVYNPEAVASPSAGVTLNAATGITFGLQGNTSDSEFALSTTAKSNTCSDGGTAVAFQGICAFLVNFIPTHPGQRSAAITLYGASSASGTSMNLSNTGSLTGVGTAADLAIDTGTASTLGSGLKPTGVATDLNGNVYVADSTGNRVLVGASSGTTLTPLITGLSSPAQVAVDNAGNVYVANTGANNVIETNSSGTLLATITGSTLMSTSLSGPKGVAVDPYGNLYVADTGNNRVVRVSTEGFIDPLQLLTSGTTAVTLSSPSQLTFDASGNLYILDSGNDRIVKVPNTSNGGASYASVVAIDSGVTPEGIAVDASGDLYVADSADKVLEYYLGATPGTVVLTGLTTPVGLAIDADANIFVADSSQTGVTEVRRSLGSASFTAVSSTNATLNNVGNFPLTLTAPIATVTGAGASVYGVTGASSNGCAAGNYAAGGTCAVTINFAPTIIGNYVASASFNSNAANSPTISLNGTVTSYTRMPTVTITPPSASITTVQSLSVTITVAGTPTNTPIPTGSVQLSSGGYTSAFTALSGGSATIVIPVGALAVGSSDTLTASYTPDANSTPSYYSATGTSSVDVSLVTPTVTVTPASSSITTAQSLSVTVAVSGTPYPSGNVMLSSTSHNVNYTSAATGLNGGIATITIPAGVLAGNYPAFTDTLTASYSGDSNYNPASVTTSVTVSIPQGIAISASSVSVPPGGNAGNTTTVTVTPSGGFTGSVSLTASITSAPANAHNLPTLSFGSTSPAIITGTTPETATLTINTLPVESSQLKDSTSGSMRGAIASAVMLECLLFAGFRSKSRKRLRSLCLIAVISLAIGGLSACSSTNNNAGTTAGTYTITITGASGSVTGTNTISLEVQ